jgi:hypothetical protein
MAAIRKGKGVASLVRSSTILTPLLSATLLGSSGGGVVSPLKLGVNVSIPNWYTYAPAFVDTAYSAPGATANEWGGFIGSTTGNPVPDANRDANGFVKSLPAGEAGIAFSSQLPPSTAPRRLTWSSKLGGSNQGIATMSMTQGGTNVQYDLPNRTVTYTPTNTADGVSGNEPTFVFTPVSSTDYPVNFVDRPVTDSGAVAIPEYASLISAVNSAVPVIRLLDWGTVNRNNSPILQTATAGKTITSITFSGTTATVTTSTAHGLLGNGTNSASASVTVTGATPATYNVSNAYVKVISPTQFQYTMGATPSGNASVVGSYTVGDNNYQFTNLHYPSTGSEPGTQFNEPLYTSSNRNKNKTDAEWHDGVMLESIVNLMTALGASPYYPVAPNSDSTFRADVAAVLAAFAQSTGKPVYQSVGNEPWNSGFTWYHQLRNEANLRGTLGDAKAQVRLVDTVGVTLSGAQTVDGVAVVTGDRILRAVPNSANNGVWVANTAGAWTRATDADATGELLYRDIWFVTSGTTYAQTSWFLSTNATITVGTTPFTISQIGGQHRYIEKVIESANAFISAFASAGASSLLNVVAEWQDYASPNIWDDMAAFAGPTDWAKVTHISVAPYYGDNGESALTSAGIGINYTGSTATLKAAITQDQDDVIGHLVQHVSKAASLGKKFITYEGGNTLNQSDQTYKASWQRSSDVYDLELRFNQQLELRAASLLPGGITHLQYNLSFPFAGSNFSWGLVEGLMQTRSKATTPKYQARVDFLAGVRVLSDTTGTFTIPYGSVNGSLVGTVKRSVYGSTLSLSGTAGGLFAIDSATGNVTVANAALITPGSSYTLGVDETYNGATHTTSFSVPATGNGTAYRYYRLLIENTTDGTNAGVAEVEFAETIGGVDTTAGQVYSDSDHWPGFDASKAFDDNPSSEYASSGSALPHSLTVDYGATSGNWKKINQVKITARGGGAGNQAPTQFRVQGSANATAWTDVIVKTGLAAWSDSETRTYST